MSKEKFLKKLKEHYEKYGLISTRTATQLPYNEICELLELNYKTFDDLEFKPHPYMEGVVSRIMFDNGYGASVVCNEISYGSKKGLYELAVLGKDGKLTYDTPITDNVVGDLSPEQVTEYLLRIQDLKS